MRIALAILSGLLLGQSHAAPEALRVLQKECFRCHTPEKRKGGLAMTTREALLKGGENGPALEPGKPEASPLVALLAEDADPHMPPKGQLTPEEISAVRTWVKAGAVWDAGLLAKSAPLQPVRLTKTPTIYRPVTVIQVSPDQSTLAVGRGAAVELFDLKGKEVTKTGELPMDEVIQSIAWSPDGKAIVTGGFRRIFVWDPVAKERVALLTDHLEGRVTALCFAGDQLIAADEVPGSSGSFRVWSARDWSWKTEKPGAHGDTIYALTLSPDGKRLASASADKEVRLWDASALELLKRLEGHTGYVMTVAFSPNGQKLASAGDDEQIKVWAMDNWKQIHAMAERRPTRAITDLLWLNDDGIVATYEDGLAREWTKLVPHEGGESSAGASKRDWQTNPCALTQLAQAGQRIVVGDENGGLEVRDPQGKPIQVLP
jgi:hypothetical protein